ncbi:zinc finger protein JAGGED-like [Andrographis paniculata]|uniref:zinc finger protein JAGGED-like n=1 Tax=Andrographis paniculata TaxID=175694 RepID=UPI0021E751F0|nr:zinc finger protein JAGGED-like [Andrographis paniculata]
MEHLPAPPPPSQNPNLSEQGRGNNEVEAEGDEREYSCNYCEKKFRSKQALGGHQNAHKLERAIERNARNFQQAPFGVNPGPTMQPIPNMAQPFIPRVTLPPPPLPPPGYNILFSGSHTVSRSINPFLGLGSSSRVDPQLFISPHAFTSGPSSSTIVARQGGEFSPAVPGNDGADYSETNHSGLDLTLKL